VQGAQRQCQQQTRAWWGCRYGRKLERRRAALGQPDDYGGAASTQQATAPTSPARDGRRAEQRLTGRGHGEGDETLQQTFPSLISDRPEGVVVGHSHLGQSTPTRGGRRRIGWASRGRPCLRISKMSSHGPRPPPRRLFIARLFLSLGGAGCASTRAALRSSPAPRPPRRVAPRARLNSAYGRGDLASMP
jgi:hypothetical protein